MDRGGEEAAEGARVLSQSRGETRGVSGSKTCRYTTAGQRPRGFGRRLTLDALRTKRYRLSSARRFSATESPGQMRTTYPGSRDPLGVRGMFVTGGMEWVLAASGEAEQALANGQP